MKTFLLAVAAALAAAPAAASNHPSEEACIAYAEADAAYEAADATYHTALKEAGAPWRAALSKATKARWATKEARIKAWSKDPYGKGAAFKAADAAEREAKAAYEATLKEAKAAFVAAEREAQPALKEARAARGAAYRSIYVNDGGRQSDVESIMNKLIARDRQECQAQYGI